MTVLSTLKEIERCAKIAHTHAVRRAAAGWRDHVQKVFLEGGGEAYALIRGARPRVQDPCLDGLPQACGGALEVALHTWLPLWWKEQH
eukprot:10420634-Karenia_brevis.AAC.1